MRLLTRRIHRAFPQLDPYPDDVCWKFIDAARGGRLFRTVSVASVLLLGLASTFVSGSLWVLLFTYLIGTDAIRLRDNGGKVLLLAVTAPLLLGFGPALAYFWRDRLLGWRLRYVLGTSGRCPACRYSLIGLALTPESTVFCPECGAECEVDPSLGELARGTTGRVRTAPTGPDAPAQRPVFERPPVLSSRQRKLLGWAAIAALLLVFVGLPGAVGVWELLIRADAAAARADLARIEADLRQLVAKSGLASPGSAAAAGRRPGFEAFQRAAATLRAAETRWRAAHADEGSTPLEPAFYTVAAEDLDAWAAANAASRGEAEAALASARDLMRCCREAGLTDRLAELAAAVPEASPTLAVNRSTLSVYPDLDGRPIPPQLDPYLEAWARQAFSATPPAPDECLAVIDARLALARLEGASPLWSDRAWAMRSESRADELIIRLLASHPDAAVLSKLRASLDRQDFDLRFHDLAEYNRLVRTSDLALLFSSPEQMRLGPFSQFARSTAVPSWSARRMGWYADNRDAVTAQLTLAPSLFQMDAPSRPLPIPPPLAPPLPAGMYAQGSGIFLTMADSMTARRRGLRILLALEQARAARGAYPDRLEALVPEFLPALPADPWSGKPFLFIPRAGPALWPFTLYSTGADGTDNQGVGPSPAQRGGIYGFNLPSGVDEVINPEPAPRRPKP